MPQAIARDVGFLTRTRVSPPGTVRFTRPLAQVKEMVDYWRKSELLAGALATERSSVAGRNIIIIDDVCRSGATLSECARSCLEAGASTVTVLAISKTWRFQRIPDRSSEPGLEAPADWEAVGW